MVWMIVLACVALAAGVLLGLILEVRLRPSWRRRWTQLRYGWRSRHRDDADLPF